MCQCSIYGSNIKIEKAGLCPLFLCVEVCQEEIVLHIKIFSSLTIIVIILKLK